MARTPIAVAELSRAGVTGTEVAGDTVNGFSIAPDGGKSFIRVRNSAGTTQNVTLKMPRTVDGLTVPDRVIAVTNGAIVFIGPFSTDYYQADGLVYIDVAHAGLNVTGLTLPA